MKLPKHRRDQAALNSRLIRRPIKRMVWLFLLPTFGAFCIGFLYPFFKGLFLSFCNFRITSQWTWTGLDNYRKAFQDPGYMHAFWYTALFALVFKSNYWLVAAAIQAESLLKVPLCALRIRTGKWIHDVTLPQGEL